MQSEIPFEDSDRLTYRRWDPSEAQFIYEMYSMPEVYQYLGSDPKPVPSLEKAAAAIDRWNSKTFGAQGFWAVTPKDSEFEGKPIGSILLLPLPRSDDAPGEELEIGWHFHPKSWGRGFATEAARAVIERAKNSGLKEVRAVVYPENLQSLALCERLKMERIGETDKWFKSTLVEYLLKF